MESKQTTSFIQQIPNTNLKSTSATDCNSNILNLHLNTLFSTNVISQDEYNKLNDLLLCGDVGVEDALYHDLYDNNRKQLIDMLRNGYLFSSSEFSYLDSPLPRNDSISFQPDSNEISAFSSSSLCSPQFPNSLLSSPTISSSTADSIACSESNNWFATQSLNYDKGVDSYDLTHDVPFSNDPLLLPPQSLSSALYNDPFAEMYLNTPYTCNNIYGFPDEFHNDHIFSGKYGLGSLDYPFTTYDSIDTNTLTLSHSEEKQFPNFQLSCANDYKPIKFAKPVVLPSIGKKVHKRIVEKEKHHIVSRKVKYDVRKAFADQRLRVKGRFLKKDDELFLKELVYLT